ncbi:MULTISPECIES: flagellar hook-associated protein FlgL [Alteromonadaceae]|jgi:flagellar hook-associated protein 3 FlgL|uniref:Flagellar hook-associated protein FlgL n=1 Tax=Brumicola blandensis TaxID=3075611 RepID=A0AAW8R0I9_9ALTE|nr:MULTISPECIES: flagellar hook-associated protein FlgL [unclassified Alteromonas]MDT0582796.1 flagellar hook-associated protein FlgL [Alteromonas sp. W409]MDT0628212.1 flagellar hook-associated protein FlgL [Alteromonas sp. W364]
MRVTTNLIYNQNLRNIDANQGNLVDIQQQLASGKKLLRPSDDPVGAAQVIRLTEELDKITQYNRNNDLTTNALELQETALRSINDVVNRARVLTVQSGNGILASEDRKAIGAEIEQIRNQVLDLMNTRNASGEYIFAGYQSSSQAFEFNPSASGNKVSFKGDDGENQIQISDSVKIQSTSSGKSIFQEVFARLNFDITATSGVNVETARVDEQGTFDKFHKANFDPVNPLNNQYRIEVSAAGDQVNVTNIGTGDIISTQSFVSGETIRFEGLEINFDGGAGDSMEISLNRPEKKNLAETLNDMFIALTSDDISETDFVNAIDNTLVGLDNGLEKMSLESSSIGARLNIAQAIKESNLDSEIALASARSSIEDVDYAKASTEFAKQETALEAAFQSFPRVSNLSLFNYIN